MASDLKVDELRAELAKRGLATTGIKPTLVRRLRAAIAQEAQQSSSGDPVYSAAGSKRQRDPEDGVSDEAVKVSAVEKFRGMSIQQLREEAQSRGISSSGSKKQLLERLCVDSPKDSDAKEEVSEERVDNNKPEKIVTATKKGAAVLDQWLPDHIKAHYHVLQLGDDIYDAMLNQTNVGENNNKFYVIQLLESDDGSSYMVYNRWGRVGVKGQDKLQGSYTSRDSAMHEFASKFHAKTRNVWSNRKNFTCYPKSYTWLEMDYTEKEDTDVKDKPEHKVALTMEPRETKLEPRVAKFISLVCNVSMMKQHMMEIGYNAEKLPLGKLSKSTILKGYDVLKRIADVIRQSNRRMLEQLSG